MKRLIKSLTGLMLISLSACNQAAPNFMPVDTAFISRAGYSAAGLKKDWFEQLRPELQEYYAEARDKTGPELFTALNEIVSRNHRVTSYHEAKSFMFAKLDNITVRKRALTGVIDVYSQILVNGTGEDSNNYIEAGDANKDGYENDVLNCEHTWPQSFYGKSLPMVSDLHHLMPVLFLPNRMRSDFPFGTATENIVYSTIGGSKLSVLSHSAKPKVAAFKKKVISGRANVNPDYEAVFEPADPQKGNTARAMLYFYLRYNDAHIRQGSFDKVKFWASKVDTFLHWADQVDPVNETDRARNEMIFAKQGNRNPFIDVPEFTALIGESVLKAK